MKFKLDENFGKRTERVFEEAGHDVQTVRQEALQGSADRHLFDVCTEEQRCLITLLHLDFADVTRFPPAKTGGIVVIRTPRNPSLPLLETMIQKFLSTLEQMPLDRDPWIVEVGRIRVHQKSVESDE